MENRVPRSPCTANISSTISQRHTLQRGQNWARMRHSREPQGWSVYNYSISIQQVTRHFMNIIIKKLINLISGAEKNSPR